MRYAMVSLQSRHWKLDLEALSTAACLITSKAGPLSTTADSTVPSGLTMTSTVSSPVMWASRATDGYVGMNRSVKTTWPEAMPGTVCTLTKRRAANSAAMRRLANFMALMYSRPVLRTGIITTYHKMRRDGSTTLASSGTGQSWNIQNVEFQWDSAYGRKCSDRAKQLVGEYADHRSSIDGICRASDGSCSRDRGLDRNSRDIGHR